jgi:hypothetical protein
MAGWKLRLYDKLRRPQRYSDDVRNVLRKKHAAEKKKRGRQSAAPNIEGKMKSAPPGSDGCGRSKIGKP